METDQVLPSGKGQIRTAIVYYHFPEDITEQQNDVLLTLLLNRIESVIMNIGFCRNTFNTVMSGIDLPQWDNWNGQEERYYQNEATIIDEMFTDIESDPRYLQTLSHLTNYTGCTFQVITITHDAVYIQLEETL